MRYKFGMVRGMVTRFFVLFLGLWVGLAPAVYTIPAAAMTLERSQPDSDGAGGCCPDADEGLSVCAQMCLNAAQFAMTAELAVLPTIWDQGYGPTHHPALAARFTIPDPDPPRSVSLL